MIFLTIFFFFKDKTSKLETVSTKRVERWVCAEHELLTHTQQLIDCTMFEEEVIVNPTGPTNLLQLASKNKRFVVLSEILCFGNDLGCHEMCRPPLTSCAHKYLQYLCNLGCISKSMFSF